MIITFEEPLNYILDAFRNLYTVNRDILICFSDEFGDDEPPYGQTCEVDDENLYVISISAFLPMLHCLEILAHELAHIAAGLDHEHDIKWEECFSSIQLEYNKILDKLEKEDK
jgi:hypothetical protein